MIARLFKRPTDWIFVAVIAFAGFAVWKTKHESDLASQLSAQNALLSEISQQLAGWPTGKPYPDSLSQLHLTYPDGGDASILKMFEYQSSGMKCTLRTRLGTQEFVRSFP